MCQEIVLRRKPAANGLPPRSASAWRAQADRPASRFRWDDSLRRLRKLSGR